MYSRPHEICPTLEQSSNLHSHTWIIWLVLQIYKWSFTSNIDRDDAGWDDLRLILHPFIWCGEWKGFRPVGLLVQCRGNVGNGTLRSVAQGHQLPVCICIGSNLSHNHFRRVIWNGLVKLKADKHTAYSCGLKVTGSTFSAHKCCIVSSSRKQ